MPELGTDPTPFVRDFVYVRLRVHEDEVLDEALDEVPERSVDFY